MMLRDYAGRAFQELDTAQNLLTMHRMFAHQHPLFICQLPGFAEDCIGHANLSNVMQQRAELQGFHFRPAQSVFPAQSQTESYDTFRMSMGLGITGLERGSQGPQG